MAIQEAQIAVLIPAYNEEAQIGGVLARVPEYVDHVVVVDDGSTDGTALAVEERARADARVHLIRFPQNQGVGAAIAAAYAWARDHRIDVVVSIDADGQMDPDEMIHLVMPVVEDRADIAKGNRLWFPEQWNTIPKVRFFGNAALSLFTKIASGYWSIADSQSGYTALSRYALQEIEWEKLYRGYGRPNDLLVRANVANCRVADVPVRAIYGVGERSSMTVLKVIGAISFLLFRRFWWRLFYKYVLRDFHPLVFFYLLGIVTGILDAALIGRMFWRWAASGSIPPINALAVTFLTTTVLNALFFAFWMDMQVNAHLSVRLPQYYAVRSEVEFRARQAAARTSTQTNLEPGDPRTAPAHPGRPIPQAGGPIAMEGDLPARAPDQR